MLARWIACGRQANRLPNIFSSQCSLSSYGINKNDTPKEKHEEDLRRFGFISFANDKANVFVDRAWEQFGLNSEPPELSEEEAEKYVKEWRNSGRLVDILDRDEMMKYSSIQQIRNLTDQEGIEHARNKRNPKRQPHRHSF